MRLPRRPHSTATSGGRAKLARPGRIMDPAHPAFGAAAPTRPPPLPPYLLSRLSSVRVSSVRGSSRVRPRQRARGGATVPSRAVCHTVPQALEPVTTERGVVLLLIE